MFKICLGLAVLTVAAFYLLAGSFLALVLYIWPIEVKTYSLGNDTDYSYRQAAPSDLQSAVNVQSQ